MTVIATARGLYDIYDLNAAVAQFTDLAAISFDPPLTAQGKDRYFINRETGAAMTLAGALFPGRPKPTHTELGPQSSFLECCTDVQVFNNSVTERFRLTTNNYRTLGLPYVEYIAEFDVSEGRISAVHATMTPGSMARVRAAAAPELFEPDALRYLGAGLLSVLAAAFGLLLIKLSLRRTRFSL